MGMGMGMGEGGGGGGGGGEDEDEEHARMVEYLSNSCRELALVDREGEGGEGGEGGEEHVARDVFWPPTMAPEVLPIPTRSLVAPSHRWPSPLSPRGRIHHHCKLLEDRVARDPTGRPRAVAMDMATPSRTSTSSCSSSFPYCRSGYSSSSTPRIEELPDDYPTDDDDDDAVSDDDQSVVDMDDVAIFT